MIHGRLLASREALETAMDGETRYELERKIEDATTRLARATSEAAKRSLESNLEILRKRVEHAHSAIDNLQVVDAELDRIENQVDLIREELLVNRDPTALSARIDAVTSMMGEANRFLQANEELLGSLGPEADPAAVPAGTPARSREPA
jgi:predicted  nucleic acid-binding Zn-ribbon protein